MPPYCKNCLEAFATTKSFPYCASCGKYLREHGEHKPVERNTSDTDRILTALDAIRESIDRQTLATERAAKLLAIIEIIRPSDIYTKTDTYYRAVDNVNRAWLATAPAK